MKIINSAQKLFVLLLFLLLNGTIVGQDYLLESFDNTTFPPSGWSQVQVSGTGLWDRQITGSNPICTPFSGVGMARFNSYNYLVGVSAVLISSSIDLSGLSGLKFQFWMYRDDLYLDKLDAVEVYINTTNSLIDAHSLGTIFRPTTATPVVSSNGWYQYNFDIPNTFNGNENYILLKATGQRGNNIFIDDVRVYKPVSPDNPPISFSVTSVTQSGMTINWVDNSTNEDGFRVYISNDDVNFTQYGSDIESTTQVQTGDDYSQIITGLLPGTTYYFRVSAFVDSESDFLTGSQATLPPDEIVSIATGNWDDPSTWSTSTIPSSIDDVTISAGHTVTLNTSGAFNGLTVDGTLSMQAYNLSGKNVTINVAGIINIVDGTTANLTITHDIINNGVLDFYSSASIFGRISFSGTNTQTFTATGTTNIGNITVNKGTSIDNLVEIIANGTFSIKSSASTGFLTLTNGTIKISGNATVSNNVFTIANYNIPSSAGFWLNNPNFTVLGQNNPNTTNNGLLHISSGEYYVGIFSGQNLIGGSGSVFKVDGGALTVSGRFSSTNTISLTLSGGVINVSNIGNTGSNLGSIHLTNASNSIVISGGDINLVQANSNSTVNNRLDYHLVGSTLNITGGNLNIGSAATVTNFNFRIRGTTPSIVVDNTNNPKTALLNAETTFRGNITVMEGSTLNLQTFNLNLVGNSSQPGNIVNNGLITNSSATGSNRFFFNGGHGTQTISGTGSIGNSTTPMAIIAISNPQGVSFESTLVANRINLLNGVVSGANNIILGNGGASSPIVQRGGSPTLIAGSFDVAPVFNPGVSYSVLYSTALESMNSGFELPINLNGTLELASNVNVTLNAATSVKTLRFSSTNVGKIVTTSENYLTISGTLVNDVDVVAGNTGYVQGPLARTLPSSLSSGSTYVFPIGKSISNQFDLVNPTTSSGGNVIVISEVFDEHPGGTEGLLIQDGSLGNRYWSSVISFGDEQFINSMIRVSQTSPELIPGNALAQSTTKTGEYNSISSTLPISNTLTSDITNTLGFFAIGLQEATLGGAVTGGSTICEGQTSELLILSGYIGNILRWESSVSPFEIWTPIAHTEPTYTSDPLTETTRFRAVVKSGSYNEEASEYTEVVVNPTTVGGSVTGGSAVCEGSSSEVLTLIDYVGTIIRWESSVSPFTEWNIIEHTDETYVSDPIFETTRFRAVVQSGVCDMQESDYTEVTVKPIPSPIISTLDNLTYCEGDEFSVTFSVDITGDSYQWLLNGNAIEDAINSSYTANIPGVYSVEVTIDDCTGLSNELEIVANPIPNPTISSINSLIICGDEEILVEFTIDITSDSYQWLLNGDEIPEATNNTFIATEVGTYSVEVTIEGCTGLSNELTIVVNPLPVPTISTDDALTYCENEEISVELSIDIAGDSFQWLLNGIAIELATSNTYFATQEGVYSVEVTTLGCIGISNEIEIIVNPLPTPTISPNGSTHFCEGEDISVELTIDINGDSYQWLLNGTAIDLAISNSYIATQEGVYWVEVTTLGCTGISNEIEVVVNPTPAPFISTDDQLEWFEGEDISLTFTVDITDADLYQWFVDDEPIENAIGSSYVAGAGGTYYVEVTVDNCTGISNQITVIVNPVPTYTVTFTVTNSSAQPVENAAIEIDDIDPIFTNEDGIATISLTNGTYAFTVVADTYKVYSDEFEVESGNISIPIQLVGVWVDGFQLSSVKIYPNPFSGYISISDTDKVERVVFTNLIGQVVKDIKPNGNETITTTDLPRGIYLVRIFGKNGEQLVRRVVKE